MRLIVVLVSLLFSMQVQAGFGIGSNKKASDSVLKKALASPQAYKIDDGGAISFGSGVYSRRFDFAGRPQVCHRNNFLYYGGAGSMLKTQMSGSGQICTRRVDPEDPWSKCVRYSTFRINKGPEVKVAIYRKARRNSDDPLDGFLGFNYLRIPSC